MIVQGIKQGIKQGIRQGINGHWSNYFPLTTGEWTSQFPGITAPTNIWGCGEASGTLADSVGGITLTSSGTVTYRETGDPLGRPAIGLGGTTARFSAASSASLDLDDVTSLSIFIRAYFPATAAATAVVGKRNSSGNLEGYAMTLRVTDSFPQSFVDFGAGATINAIVSVAADDAVFRDYLIVVDRTSQLVVLRSGLGDQTASIATATTLTNTGLFSIGQMAGATNALAGTKVSYCAAWVGTVISDDNFTTLTTRT